MALTLNQMKRILIQLAAGETPTLKGPEVDEYIKDYKRQIKEGFMIEIPFEMLENLDEDDTDEEEDVDIETLMSESYYKIDVNADLESDN